MVRDAVDFLGDRVVFAPPPARGEAFAFAAPRALILNSHDAHAKETRMKRHLPQQYTGRVLALALGLAALC